MEDKLDMKSAVELIQAAATAAAVTLDLPNNKNLLTIG